MQRFFLFFVLFFSNLRGREKGVFLAILPKKVASVPAGGALGFLLSLLTNTNRKKSTMFPKVSANYTEFVG